MPADTPQARLRAVQQRIDAACARAGRDRKDVRLIAVSKTHPPDKIAELHALGQLQFGENYAQELRDKAPLLAPDLSWHFIGQIQSNKAKYIAPHAYRVHALTEVRHAEALGAKSEAPVRCLVSVNTGGESTKGGVPPEDALKQVERLMKVPNIEIVGLMTLPPFDLDLQTVAIHFEQLADLAHRGRVQGLPTRELSMGMSHDFEVAITYGANWVRVGTALFGTRGTGPWRPAP